MLALSYSEVLHSGVPSIFAPGSALIALRCRSILPRSPSKFSPAMRAYKSYYSNRLFGLFGLIGLLVVKVIRVFRVLGLLEFLVY